MIVKLFTSLFLNNGLKKSVLTTLILISLFFCSCNTDNNVMKQYYTMTDINKNIHDITSAVYTDVEIDDIINNQYDICSLNEKYPVECVRYRSKYNVCYVGEKSYAILYYEKDGTYSWSQKCKMSELNLNDYLVLEKGMLLSTVNEIDPAGDYFLTQGMTGRTTPSVSMHYTKDGYVVEIYYDTTAVGENHPKIKHIFYYLL